MLTELVHYNDKINTAWYCSPSVNMHRSKFDANANSCSVITSYWVFKANVSVQCVSFQLFSDAMYAPLTYMNYDVLAD